MSEGARSARAAGKVSIAVFLSRILGLVRDQLFAKLFGAGFFNDAWLVAFRIPNLLRDLFAEGALSAALVPTFAETLRKQGRTEAWHLANLVLSGLLVVLGVLTLALFFASDWFVTALAAGFADVPGKAEVTSILIKILSPFLMLVALASLAMSLLNTLNHFFLPALAPALFNVALILSGLLLVPWFERIGVLPVYAMGVGAILGGVLQYAVQIPLLRREGYRFRFRIDFKHPGIRRMGRLLGPALVGVSAVQINILVNTQLASFLQDNGPVSWLSYAFRIIYLPIGLFGVAIGVVNLRDVSVHAAGERFEDLKETVANSVKLLSFLAIPSSVGLIVLARPVVDVLFERGGFTAQDTVYTAWALIAYSLGLFAYSCNKIYVPTFYALDDTRTPVRITVVTVLANLAANVTFLLLLPAEYRFVGLAAGTSISVTLSNSLLASALRRRLGDFRRFRIARGLCRHLTLALVMGLAVFFVDHLFGLWWTDPDLAREIVALGGCLAVGGALYLGLAAALGVPEMGHLVQAWRRRLG